MDPATIEIPVTNNDTLRTAEEALPRIIADLSGEPAHSEARRR